MQSFIITIKEDTIEATGPDGIRVEPQPFTWQPTPELAPTLAQLADESSRVPPEAVQGLGAALYDALFSREIAVAFSQAQSNVGEKNLRLTLQIESPHLAALPWEALFHQADWLATDSSTPLVRRLPDTDGQSIQTLEVNRPLKVLFIGASPTGMADLNVAEQYAQLRDRLQEPLDKKIIALDGLFHPTPDQLRQTLLKDYHIIYFAGHGAPEQVETSFDGTTKTVPACIFINQTAQTKVEEGETVPAPGAPERVTAEMVAGMLRGRKNTRLVFLAACNTSTTVSAEEGQLLSGFAQQLTSRAKLPAMVAMQYYISNMQAIPLTAHFFAAIAEFVPVDVALADARNTLIRRGEVGRDVFAPVMYLQAENAALFKKAWNRAALALAAVLAVVLVLASIGGYLLEGQRAIEETRANAEATKRAEEEAVSTSLELVEHERMASKDDHELSLLLAIEAVKTAHTKETENVLRETLTRLERPRETLRNIKHSAISSDKTRILTVNSDDTATIWDIKTGNELQKLDIEMSPLQGVTWGPDSTTIVTLGSKARVWGTKTSKQIASFSNHRGLIAHVDWNFEDNQIVTGGYDGTARIWDATTGYELFTLTGHNDTVWYVEWSPDNSKILTASHDGTASVWEANTGHLLFTLSGHSDALLNAMWSFDGTRIATASADGFAKIWDTETGNELATLTGHTDFVRRVIWSSDDRQLMTVSQDGSVRIWGPSNDFELINTLNGHSDGIIHAAWSPQGDYIVTGSFDNTAKVWNTKTGKELFTLDGHGSDAVTQVLWDKTGKYIVTGSWDGTSQIWNAETGKNLAVLGHKDEGWRTRRIWRIELSPDNQHLATVGDDGIARIWDMPTGTLLNVFYNHMISTEDVTHIKWSPDDKFLVTAGYGSAITPTIWNVETGELSVMLLGHTISNADWHPDGTKLVTASSDGTAKVWNTNTGEMLFNFTEHSGKRVIERQSVEIDAQDNHTVITDIFESTYKVNHAVWNSDGSKILTVGDDGVGRIWDGQTGKLILTLTNEATAWDVDGKPIPDKMSYGAWSPDDRKIVIIGKVAWIYDALNGENLLTLSGHGSGRLHNVAWDNIGMRIVTVGSTDNTARLWNVQTGQLLRTLQHKSIVKYAEWNSDNTHIVTSSFHDGIVKIWDAISGELVTSLVGHTDTVNTVKWDSTGTKLVTTSDDETAKIWSWNKSETISLFGHTNSVNEVSWSKDSSILVTSSDYDSTHIWDATNGIEIAIFKSDIVALNDNGTQLATIIYGNDPSDDDFTQIWNLLPKKKIVTVSGHVRSNSWSPEGTRIVTVDDKGGGYVWSVENGELLTALKGREGYVWNIAWSNDGKQIAIASQHGDRTIEWDNETRIYDAETGTQNSYFKDMLAVEWSPDNTRLLMDVTGFIDHGAVQIWDSTAKKSLTGPMQHDYNMTSIGGWSPNGDYVLTTNIMSAKIWDSTNGKLVKSINGHSDTVNYAGWNDDGSLIVTTSADGSAKIWSVEMGNELITLSGGVENVRFAVWSPDETRIALAGGARGDSTGITDNTVKIYLVTVDDLLIEACKRVTRNMSQNEWERYFDNKTYNKTCSNTPKHTTEHRFSEDFIKTIDQLLKSGKDQDALEFYYQTITRGISLNPDMEVLRYFCVWGVFNGHYDKVIEACTQTINSVHISEKPLYYDLRGIAFALTGNFAEASDDLQSVVDIARVNNINQEDIVLRKLWVSELEAGQNPFDEATLKELLEE